VPEAYSPTLPAAALYPALALLAAGLAVVLWRVRDGSARFVIAAVWLRFVMSALHPYTYPPVAAGLSLNALASCGVFAVGLGVVSARSWRLKAVAPVLAVAASVALSGALSGLWSGAFSAIVKWGYFAVLLLAAVQAIGRLGRARFFGFACAAFSAPLLLQWLSLGLGVSKQADEDGGRAYIGGYEHEAAFSVALVGALFTAAQARALPAALRWLLVLACLAGLVLAGYRTSLIAAAPLAAAFVLHEALRALRRSDRPAAALIMGVLVAGALGAAAYALRARFADFAALLQNSPLLRRPGDYTLQEQELFSARLYLWAQYLDAYASASMRRLLFGFGPDAWQGRFLVYAHNTLVSTVFEYGAFGLAALAWLWGSMAARAVRAARRAPDGLLLLAGMTSFFLLNMATMAQWLVEGLILFALAAAAVLGALRAPEPAALRGTAREQGRGGLLNLASAR
jgi:O-antigen ligase